MIRAPMTEFEACWDISQKHLVVLQCFCELTQAGIQAVLSDQLDDLSQILSQRQVCMDQADVLQDQLRDQIQTGLIASEVASGQPGRLKVQLAVDQMDAARRDRVHQAVDLDQELIRQAQNRKQALLCEADSPWHSTTGQTGQPISRPGVLFSRIG